MCSVMNIYKVCTPCIIVSLSHYRLSPSGGCYYTSDSGSRSSSGDTGEGERTTGSMIQHPPDIPMFPMQKTFTTLCQNNENTGQYKATTPMSHSAT